MSSPGFQRRETADEAAIRKALAQRQAWTMLGSRSLEPAKVQDPPALTGETPPADAYSDAAAAETAPAAGEVKMARRLESRGRANNEDLIREALRNRNKPYIWGGASRGGFDCSGFVVYLFRKQRGMKLPHSASGQARLGTPVPREELQPGDLVFFSTYRPGISHVGIWIGNDRFIHAANTRRDVRIDGLTGYYGRRYKTARRISPAPMRFTPADLDRLTHDQSELPVSGEE